MLWLLKSLTARSGDAWLSGYGGDRLVLVVFRRPLPSGSGDARYSRANGGMTPGGRTSRIFASRGDCVRTNQRAGGGGLQLLPLR